MLSIISTKVCKEFIYSKKHTVACISLEEIIAKYKKSKDPISEVVNFFLSQINFEKVRFTMKLLCNEDGKYKMNVNQIRQTISEMMIEAVTNFMKNPSDSVYISENIILSVTKYSGKHQITIAPRLDFTK